MGLFDILILGLIQGLTEFLPVSSSGHLVITSNLLGMQEESSALLVVILHVGTLIPVLWIFREQVRKLLQVAFRPRTWAAGMKESDAPHDGAELFRFVGVATLVTMAIALPAKKMGLFDGMFDSPVVVGVALLFTTALLVASRYAKESGEQKVFLWQAVVVGAAQAIAVTPGISRSGTTIVVGLMIGIPLVKVGAFSFLMSVPAICGGLLLEVLDNPITDENLGYCVVGLLVAGASGYLAVRWTMACISTKRLYWFAPYTLILALAVLLFMSDGGPAQASSGG